MIQLVNQLKGYFYINPVLALSLAITIFSFVGVPPLVGFFGKQMILSAALDKGLLFLSLVAILTSVIGAVYYLSIVKEMFFSKPYNKVNTLLENLVLKGKILDQNKAVVRNVSFKYNNIAISSPIAFVISSITLVILLFIFINREWLSMGKQKLFSFFNKIYLIYNKSIRCFYFLKFYSTIFINNYTTNIKNNNNKLINPRFITVFFFYKKKIAEGSFMLHLEKNKDKWRVRPTF